MAQPLTEGRLSLDTGIKVNLDDGFLVVAFKKEKKWGEILERCLFSSLGYNLHYHVIIS